MSNDTYGDSITPFVTETIEDAVESLLDSAATLQRAASLRREIPGSTRNVCAKHRLALACEVDSLLRNGDTEGAHQLLRENGITVRHPICTS